MPTIHVVADYFFKLLGKTLNMKELDSLCFEFGIECDEEIDAKGAEPRKLAFELPANRYDLLAAEGLAKALSVFIGTRPEPILTVSNKDKPKEQIIVTAETQQIRGVVVGAILRNVTFDQERYDSFIDYQDKLHHNIGRKRTLVSIGTHDLDTVKGPFTYTAKAPKDIKFVPLNQQENMDGERLMAFYQNDNKLKQFLHIIEKSPVYPVIYDANGVVCSLPPIINGDHSKIKLTTKNVFIEITATDHTKALVTLNCVISAFSQFCAEPFSVEEVEIVYPDRKETTPDLSSKTFNTNVQYINNTTGLSLDAARISELLKKMGLTAKPNANGQDLEVVVPPIRGDVLHPCDIAEDVAIAFGYDNVPNALVPSSTVGDQQINNKMTDLLRAEVAQAGYKECLNFALNSLDEITKMINRDVDDTIVKIANPKTHDFQVARNTLIPGLLKCLSSNQTNKLPIHLFEITDVVLKAKNEIGARNERRLAALQSHRDSSGLEYIHGLVDYIMVKLRVPKDEKNGYSIKGSSNSTFFPERQAQIFYKDQPIGIFGILHPVVLQNFDWHHPVSLVELNLEPLFAHFFTIHQEQRAFAKLQAWSGRSNRQIYVSLLVFLINGSFIAPMIH
eukprot:TRINITY_DN4234_c0_g1_i3.p1 TRINITY_DN4234_c0_g1~~TRINITY_DN4234_c0_g1_i3.p1  ORF type:complete len:619 (-),score=219.13 TRINITY_DN4234_c0_g1_i3:276-2132(-)